jgi:hypothetical protein
MRGHDCTTPTHEARPVSGRVVVERGEGGQCGGGGAATSPVTVGVPPHHQVVVAAVPS